MLTELRSINRIFWFAITTSFVILFATSLVNDDHSKVRLVLAGGARNSEDEGRVTDLRNLCKHLAVEDNVEFKARQRPIPPKKFFIKNTTKFEFESG